MTTRDEIIQEVALGFDEIRAEFSPGATLELLKISSESDDFLILADVESGWFIKYNEFRNQFKLQIASLDPDFKELMNEVESVRVDGYVYTVAAGDRIQPTGASLFWTVFCTRQTGRQNVRAAR